VTVLMALAFLAGSLILRPRYVMLSAENPVDGLTNEARLASFGAQNSVPSSQLPVFTMGHSPIRARKESSLARSMIVIDRQTGSPILTENSTEQMPIASLTKLMTAYIVVHTWEPEVLFTIAVQVDPDAESSAQLPIGATYTRDDLLAALLIRSAAEAGYTFADSYPGGRPAFVAKMNFEAQELGLASTVFVDPVGISELNISTTTDLSMLTRAVLSIAPLPNIVGATAKEICSLSGICTTLENTNTLLSESKDFYGVKTGYTVKAGPCLVAWYKKGNADFIIVLLYVEGQGTDNRFDVAEELSSLAWSATM